MRAILALPLAAAFVLAGCNNSPSSDTGTNAAVAEPENSAVTDGNGTDNVQAKVLAMSDRERNVVFIRAILDAGLPCQSVTSSTRVADQDGQPVWRATCSGGDNHMISITPDGIANIVSRTDR